MNTERSCCGIRLVDRSGDSGTPGQDREMGNIPSLNFYDGKEESGSVELAAHVKNIGRDSHAKARPISHCPSEFRSG